MGRISLQIKATLENIAGLKITAEADWNFKVKCTNCQTENENIIYFNLADRVELQNSRATATFV